MLCWEKSAADTLQSEPMNPASERDTYELTLKDPCRNKAQTLTQTQARHNMGENWTQVRKYIEGCSLPFPKSHTLPLKCLIIQNWKEHEKVYQLKKKIVPFL